MMKSLLLTAFFSSLSVSTPAKTDVICDGECMVLMHKPADLMPTPSAISLLDIGYKVVAEGDLLVDRFAVNAATDKAALFRPESSNFEKIAQVPSRPINNGVGLKAVGARYASYIRLERDGWAFVCIIDNSDVCHRAYGGESK
jgi:hypothetical protein